MSPDNGPNINQSDHNKIRREIGHHIHRNIAEKVMEMYKNNTNFALRQKANIRNTSHTTRSVLIKPYYQTQIGLLKFFAYFYLFNICNNKVKREITICWNSMYENKTYNNEANCFRRNVGSEK